MVETHDRSTARQAVEYKVAYVDFRGRISSDGVEFIRQSGEHRTTFVSRYLGALGRDGWSLSGIQPLARPDTSYFVLQRAVIEDSPGDGQQAQRA
jgi:hypothetical protein